MIVVNPFCDLCEDRECWRSICRTCGGYTAIHLLSRQHAETISQLHHCRPLSIPADRWETKWVPRGTRRSLP